MATWIIDEDEGGYDILLNARAYQYGFDDEDEAIAFILRSREYLPTDDVWTQDANGNRERADIR
jgi:hypothetical protein